jgi:SAM-dependent methyltransferase
MHDACEQWVKQAIEKWGPFESVLEFGSRDVNGSVRPLFGDAIYLGVDLVEGSGVDIVADAKTFRSDMRYDVVVCTNVFEHEKNWRDIVYSAWLALRKDGIFIVTTVRDPFPHHSKVDGGGLRPHEYYGNIERVELCRGIESKGFIVLDERSDNEPDSQVVARKVVK